MRAREENNKKHTGRLENHASLHVCFGCGLCVFACTFVRVCVLIGAGVVLSSLARWSPTFSPTAQVPAGREGWCVCVCVCVCERERDRERERERERERKEREKERDKRKRESVLDTWCW